MIVRANKKASSAPVASRLFVMAASIFLCGAVAAQTQKAVRDELFGATDAAKVRADAAQASMLAPDAYAQAMSVYSSAGKELEKAKNLDRVRQQVTQAEALFEKATKAAELAKVTFASSLQARDAANRAEASKYAVRDWQRAEQGMVSAARRLESGNLKGATKDSQDVEKRYKDAEMKALNAKASASK